MLGVFPAIPQQEVDEVVGKGFNAKAKYTNSVLNESDAVTPIVYTDTPAMKPVRKGESTASATAYKYDGTGIQKSDNTRAHVCDIPNVLRFEQALEALKSSTLFQTIRKGIEALTAAAASSPLTTQIVGAIKVLRGILRAINEFLDFINGVLLEIARYIAYVQKMIAWLLSLPAELLRRFSDCLASLRNSLLAAVTGTSSGTSELVSEFTGLVRDISTTINATGATISASQNALNPNSFSGRI